MIVKFTPVDNDIGTALAIDFDFDSGLVHFEIGERITTFTNMECRAILQTLESQICECPNEIDINFK